MVETAVDTVRAQAAAKQIEVQTSMTDAPLIVQGSPVRLQQVIWNLLTNAIKFTEPGGRVSIGVEGSEGEAHVHVEDTGVGIAPEFLPYVFDRFRQADGSTTRLHGGLGLGLAIVRALVRLHGGTVSVESDGLGRGSRFTFTLPYEVHVRDDREVSAYESDCPVPHSVLVVEDSPDTLSLLNVLFQRKGCRVLAAESAAEAIEIASHETPDIIISDIGMPEMNGYELLTALRKLPGLENVPAVAITGYAMEEDRDRALAAGFDAHIAKPVDPDELFEVVQKLATENQSRV